jgi:hypothetical protein
MDFGGSAVDTGRIRRGLAGGWQLDSKVSFSTLEEPRFIPSAELMLVS